VTVDGQVGRTSLTHFHINGKLYVSANIPTILTPNGDNPRDCILYCGNPLLAPAAGVIWVSSNAKLFETVNLANLGSLLPLDDCLVNIDDLAGTLQMQLSATEALQLLQNGFNSSGGILATIYRPKTGSISLTFSQDGQSVSGSVNIVAVDILNRNVTYSATITGTRS